MTTFLSSRIHPTRIAARPAGARMPLVRRCRTVIGCTLAMLLALPLFAPAASPRQPEISLEYAVKATYLYKLAPFVDWPSGTFASPDAPFDICVLGRDPFKDYLEKAIAGRKLGTHPFEVRRLDVLAPDDDCQVVFISYARAERIRQALRALDGKPVLTVTDSGAARGPGSIVQFVISHGHVRFEIDNRAAARNRLVISSKLLNLALAVKGSD
jgi:hypothetical protein